MSIVRNLAYLCRQYTNPEKTDIPDAALAAALEVEGLLKTFPWWAVLIGSHRGGSRGYRAYLLIRSDFSDILYGYVIVYIYNV